MEQALGFTFVSKSGLIDSNPVFRSWTAGWSMRTNPVFRSWLHFRFKIRPD
jgi:hypothetical protein